jgi:ABC-type nitrate/sulfonate/bicarbonate transport system substrate-binding protein
MLSWLNAYRPPRGLDARDAAFVRELEKRQEWVEERAAEAYREASRFLLKGYPEVAFAEIESHLRLDPDSRKGRKLRKRIIATLPQGLRLPRKAGFRRRQQHVPTDISAMQIRQLMRQGKLLQARSYAVYYRRRGGKDADTLLKAVQVQISKAAAEAFGRGRKAFREERLADAVRYWRRAVALMPDESTYVESLRRAEQLRERLRILRSGK